MNNKRENKEGLNFNEFISSMSFRPVLSMSAPILSFFRVLCPVQKS